MRTLLPVLILLLSGAVPVAAEESASCLRIDRVTAFAPRGEVYVEVQASCTSADFQAEDSIHAYLEVLVGEAAVVGDDVRVVPSEPRIRKTFTFRDLALSVGQPVLVRLVRFGEILDLETFKVP